MQGGIVSPPRPVPEGIARPPYVGRPGPSGPAGVQRHRGSDLERLRHAGAVAAEVLASAGAAVAPGVTTDELDGVAHDTYVRLGAYPSTLGYKGYPKSICTSVNEVVCHGIPDDRPLVAGDIVNVDVTAYVDGVHGDTSATFTVGEVDPPTAGLVELTRVATLLGIAAVGPGEHLSAIAEAIEPFAVDHGLEVVRDWGGHGIGAVFHAAPHVNHGIERGRTIRLEPGVTFTVEPMLTAGTSRHHLWADDWTVVTDDLLPSAQFEHTVIVTEDGVEILTLTPEGRSAVGDLTALEAGAR
ncbi:MAG: type I methionyl aminopeptidase [Acidimicrobiia bacterium]|nr:type I methionyl aminopeptidase [Acidimicrobiia bacterium]